MVTVRVVVGSNCDGLIVLNRFFRRFEMADERVLTEVADDFGMIRIIEMGHYRILEFGQDVEQSCVYVPDPTWLEYDYTRAMLLGALWHDAPRSALFLGVGAGSLIQACLKHLPLERIEGIELRPIVLTLAHRYLGLKPDPRLHLHVGDAMEMIAECDDADLIFLDLYTDTGPSPAHLAWNFLGVCREKLRPGGWLIINQWSDAKGKPLGAAFLRGRYHHHYWECPVPSGNVILFVPESMTQSFDADVLRQRAQALEAELGYPLQPLIEQLRPAQ